MNEKTSQRMDDRAWEEFEDYLARHEQDIANDINDFGGLRFVFRSIKGREPERQ